MYTDQKVEYITTGVALTAAADKLRIVPGITPVRVRKLGVIIGAAVTTSSAVVTWRLRPTHGSSAGQTSPLVQTITTAIGLAGKVIYADGLDILVRPGQELNAEVTTAAGGGGTGATFFAEAIPEWEAPANNTNMTRVVA